MFWFVTKQLIQGSENNFLQVKFVYGSGMAFKAGGFKPADAAPDDGFAAVVVPMNSSEHFTAVTTNDYLREAMIAAVAAFLSVGAGFNNMSAHKFSCTRM